MLSGESLLSFPEEVFYNFRRKSGLDLNFGLDLKISEGIFAGNSDKIWEVVSMVVLRKK